jgi:ABC-type methionine transport system ATPase subunit
MALHRYYLTFTQAKIKEPIVYWVGQKYRVITNIRGASISDHVGIMALELEGEPDEIEKAVAWIAEQGIQVEPIEKNVIE